ncbi:MAG: ComF family protein [Candidatus Thiodiazotropha taylori]|nr:ComF family protein [Candidatus Thiodiazotropha taylori]
MKSNWLETLLKQLYPQSCLLCGAQTDHRSRFCDPCYQSLPFNHHACPRCALPLPADAPAETRCGACLKSELPYASCHTALRYEAPSNHLITQLKFRHQLHLTKPLARLITDRLGELQNPPDLMLPVPLHQQRMRERGFNQAQELARVVAKHYRIPLEDRLVKRARNTKAQSDLSERLRRNNLRHAFRVHGSLQGSRVAILDDVITTGSTINELSKTLQRHGAAEITVWAVARSTIER